MPVSEIKTSAPAKNSIANHSFFSKKESGSFFGIPNHAEYSFFKPSSNYPIQNSNILQTKLTIGQPNDKYEKEADAMADKVVQRLSNPETGLHTDVLAQTKPISAAVTPVMQRKCAHCEKEEKLQRKEDAEKEYADEKLLPKLFLKANSLPPDDTNNVQCKCTDCEKEGHLQRAPQNTLTATEHIESNLMSSKGSGAPLPQNTRQQMESSFGADFSNIRIHTDNTATQMSEGLHAHAFTHGNDIYFNAGKYNTASTEGTHLLAHELTHTMQQGGVHRYIQRTANSGRLCNCHDWRIGLPPWLAGTAAHGQIASFMSVGGMRPQGIPRATKTIMGVPSPPSGTPWGFADLWTNRLSDTGIAEIKSSAAGDSVARPEVSHYILRHDEWLARLVGGAATDSQDSIYNLLVGGPKIGNPLDISPYTGTGISLGPFVADPLKLLWFEGDATGSVVYWCTDWLDPKLLALIIILLAALREAMRIAKKQLEEAMETARAIMKWIGENWEIILFFVVLIVVIALIVIFAEAILAFLAAVAAAIAAGAATVAGSLSAAAAGLAAAAALLFIIESQLATIGIDGSQIRDSGTELSNTLLQMAPDSQNSNAEGYDKSGNSATSNNKTTYREVPDFMAKAQSFSVSVATVLNPVILIEKAMSKII